VQNHLVVLGNALCALEVSRTSVRQLLPETIAQADGEGPISNIDELGPRLLVVTLGINRVIEQVDLSVSVWGSADQTNWGAKPLAAFPQRSYCGLYSILLNLAVQPEIRYLRVRWKMHRWSKATSGPLPGLFEFRVHAQPSGARLSATACK
jgi:hypothetical protein